MTEKEFKLAAFLLSRAADEFSNHGCNDIDDEIIKAAGFTLQEEFDFCHELQRWNGGDDAWPPNLSMAADYNLMEFLAHKLKTAAPGARR